MKSKTKPLVLGVPVLAAVAAGVAVGLASRVAWGSWAASGNAQVPQPCREVDLSLYLGKWYELARYDNRFENRCDGVTAEYELLANGEVGIKNTCRCDWPSGKLRVSTGRAKVVPDSGNAKLKVSFFGPFYAGNYWILDHADDYGWSIVGEPTGQYLWILVRDPQPDKELHDQLYARVTELGYDTARLRMTRQEV